MAETKSNKNEEKLVKIKLPRLPKNNEDVFVSINERTWMIKRGVEVEVPECVEEAIRNQEEMQEEAYQYNSSVQK